MLKLFVELIVFYFRSDFYYVCLFSICKLLDCTRIRRKHVEGRRFWGGLISLYYFVTIRNCAYRYFVYGYDKD